MTMRIRTMAALACLLATTSAFAAPDTRPKASVEGGTLAGTAEGATLVFRGVPFASAERWKPPVAARPWQGVRDASRFGAACPQPGDHKEAWAQVGPTAEDCLFLNVWRPSKPGNYPVMFFIHGGAFTYGAAGVPLYDGQHLAERGVVVVTINYRLGRLGFFAHPALTRENPGGELGNYGIMDQVAALRWVHRNIARFGGDAANVTIFGESAGAGSVQILMGKPELKELFTKGVSESGAGNSVLVPIRGGATNAEALGQQWAAGVGLANATADQLRALPLDTVVKNGRSFPFIDGKVVKLSPGDPFRRGAALPIPLLIGGNSNEGSLVGNNTMLGMMAYGSDYAGLLADYQKRPGIPADAAALDLMEDALMLLPSVAVGQWQAKANPHVYSYNFRQVPVDQRAKSLGTPHGGEVEYLFGNEPAGERWDADDRRVSNLTGDYWVRFARTGDPNGGGAPAWPAIGTGTANTLVIDAKPAAATLTPVEERAEAVLVDKAVKGWDATPSP